MRTFDSIAAKIQEHSKVADVSANINCIGCGEKLFKCEYSNTEIIFFSKVKLAVDGVTYTVRIHGFGAHDETQKNPKSYFAHFCHSPSKMDAITLK